MLCSLLANTPEESGNKDGEESQHGGWQRGGAGTGTEAVGRVLFIHFKHDLCVPVFGRERRRVEGLEKRHKVLVLPHQREVLLARILRADARGRVTQLRILRLLARLKVGRVVVRVARLEQLANCGAEPHDKAPSPLEPDIDHRLGDRGHRLGLGDVGAEAVVLEHGGDALEVVGAVDDDGLGLELLVRLPLDEVVRLRGADRSG